MTGQDLYRRARRRIPGGTQLFSKRPELLLPEQWPAYYSRARGAEVWDVQGNRYIDMSYAGIGATVLGFADPDVDEAVHDAIARGNMTTLNCPEEVELADLLCELHPWAEMVRYARCGGEAMSVAVRIARAHTRREKVAFCGYHGWHDWYLAANLARDSALDGHLLTGLAPAGVPRSLTGSALPFHYNRLPELQSIVAGHGSDLAAIVMEPMRDHEPEPGFLEGVRELAREVGAVFIFDEITAGWRINTGGIHLTYGVSPDIAVFAKAMSNGYPMAAILGTGEVMEAAQDSFISSTYWTERIGPAAALATIRKHRERKAPQRLFETGSRIQAGWRAAAERAGIPLTVTGIPALSHFTLNVKEAQPARTLFTQGMLDRGFLATNAFYAMYAHEDRQVEAYLAAVEEVFSEIGGAIRENRLMNSLRGPVAHAGFCRLT
ncbi:MAG: aminotransferase class III-fold pyridoxal phosphate-dependent enzyme [Bryobacterales bacterium]|nr:aminotransferase class III-fold pyridoxal phosphate-dependent enzyme [Bryobacterales bacterium]